MQVELNELLRGKATKIKDKQFYPTAAYVEPFLERMQKYTNEFVYNVKLPDQITTVDDTDDITYNRVWVQAVLPEKYAIENGLNDNEETKIPTDIENEIKIKAYQTGKQQGFDWFKNNWLHD